MASVEKFSLVELTYLTPQFKGGQRLDSPFVGSVNLGFHGFHGVPWKLQKRIENVDEETQIQCESLDDMLLAGQATEDIIKVFQLSRQDAAKKSGLLG